MVGITKVLRAANKAKRAFEKKAIEEKKLKSKANKLKATEWRLKLFKEFIRTNQEIISYRSNRFSILID